jgi:WD40 repeat protein
MTFSIQENMTEAEKKNELKKEEEMVVKEQLSAAAFSATHVFSGFDDGFVSAWNMSNLSEQVSFAGHEKRVNEISVAGTRLVTGSSDSTIRVWDIATGQGEVVFKVGGQVNKMQLQQDRLFALVQRNILYELDIVRQ